MEWEDSDLHHTVLKRSEIPDIFRDICSGLAYVHEKHFTHRDIKQSNILIGESAELGRRIAKITDFGLTKQNGDQPMLSFAGTPIYQAPEMFDLPEVPYSSAVDIWALGLLLLELIIRKGLGDLLEEVGLAHTHSFGELHFHLWFEISVRPRKEAVPTEYRPLLDGMIDTTPSRRWTAAKCVSWLDAQPDLVSCLPELALQLLEGSQVVDPTQFETSGETNVVDLSQAWRMNVVSDVPALDQQPSAPGREREVRSSSKRTLALASLATTQEMASANPSAKKKGKILMTT